jgi:predicted nucleic acid-binding Zn ribbon protein
LNREAAWTMTRRDDLPMSLHDSLIELTSELRVAGPDAMRIVQEQWPTLVGRELAPHVRLGSLRNGTLTLEVDDPVWATPLGYLESGIVETLAEHLGRGVVRTVKIAVRRR